MFLVILGYYEVLNTTFEILNDGKHKPILIHIQMKLGEIMRYHYLADY